MASGSSWLVILRKRNDMTTWKSADTFDTIYQDAISECKTAAQFDLVLSYELPIAVLKSAFVDAYKSKAEKWISDPAPRDLVFSHGEFFKGKRGTEYLLGELERKKLSRRAMLTMIDMETLIDSEHASVPAFNLLQFAIDADVLYVTAYFRALEVAAFLPTNLTEIALHCESIEKRFGHLQRIRLFLLAFRAYHDPNFHCLEKLPIDSQEPGTIGVAVAEHQHEKVRGWLNGKFLAESVVQLEGIREMLTAVRLASQPYPKEFVLALERAVADLHAFGEARNQFTEGSQVNTARKRFEQSLTTAVDTLPK